MFKPRNILILLFVIATLNIYGQSKNFKFKNVSTELLEAKSHEIYPEANASIIHRECEVLFEYNESKGQFEIKTDVVERIKIYNEDGFDYADYVIGLYSGKSVEDEKISQISAFTFNLENGKAESVKVEKKDIYIEETNKYWKAYKIPMPNVKAGSVLEIKYTKISPYLFQIPEFNFQEEIPVNYAEYVIGIPEYFNYNTKSKGFIPLDLEEKSGQGRINYTYTYNSGSEINVQKRRTTETVLFDKQIKTFVAKDVPPLISESAVTTMKNYQSAISFELLTTQFPGSNVRSYTSSWTDIAKLLNKSQSFDGILNGKSKDIDDIVSAYSILMGVDKAKALYRHFSNLFTWNEYLDIEGMQTSKKFFEEGTGNIGDINLRLINAMRTAGLEAYPVVMRSRNSGFLNATYPSISDLDYVVGVLQDGEATYFFDATAKGLPFGSLPVRAINLKGVLLTGEEAFAIDIPNTNKFNIVKSLNLQYEDGALVGTRQSRYSGFASYRKRQEYGDNTTDEIISKANNTYPKIKISSCEFRAMDEYDKPLSCVEEVDYSAYIEELDGKIFIPMSLDLSYDANPYREGERNFALFFEHVMDSKGIINISVPQGYAIESLPEPLALSLGEDEVVGIITAKNVGSSINVNISFSRKNDFIAPEQYPYLVQFYDEFITKSKEMIVLAKI